MLVRVQKVIEDIKEVLPWSFIVMFDSCWILHWPLEKYLKIVKFGHVTFFWNGNRSGYFDPSMEEYTEVPSDIGIAFNLQPKMKASKIAEKAREAIRSHKYNQMRTRQECF
ncbi:hypothetical protein Taro_007919 [Colocasia esculenta]|uniref:Metalloenzyme domain-containing protein n=1 Tax=Colocasia esculenta TaxID=4460 RepID=A0A843TZM8_COLES|nr:hypothetical protein [Colocasia esculenta]